MKGWFGTRPGSSIDRLMDWTWEHDAPAFIVLNAVFWLGMLAGWLIGEYA